MKKILVALLLISNICTAQISKSFYARVVPFSLTTIPIYSSSGTSSSSTVADIDTVRLKDRILQNMEFGYSYGVMDVGLCIGMVGKSKYIETRITIDGLQIGNFSNEFTIGAGYVDNASPIMLEASSTIMMQVSPKMGLGLITSYYTFAGNVEDVSRACFGVYLRYGILRSSDGVVSKISKKVRHKIL